MVYEWIAEAAEAKRCGFLLSVDSGQWSVTPHRFGRDSYIDCAPEGGNYLQATCGGASGSLFARKSCLCFNPQVIPGRDATDPGIDEERQAANPTSQTEY